MAEKAVRELEDELPCKDRLVGAVTTLTLPVATAQLSAYYSQPRSVSESCWYIGTSSAISQQMPLSNRSMTLEQHKQRIFNHPQSERSKAPRMYVLLKMDIIVGSSC